MVDDYRLPSCYALSAPQGKNDFLNSNSPIHLGGWDLTHTWRYLDLSLNGFTSQLRAVSPAVSTTLWWDSTALRISKKFCRFVELQTKSVAWALTREVPYNMNFYFRRNNKINSWIKIKPFHIFFLKKTNF